MQAVVLAAGMGRRLGKLTESSTKCMVRLGPRRLIEYTLDAVVDVGASRIVMVVGHGADEVRAVLGGSWRGVPIVYVENVEYQRTNNIYSLLLAAPLLAEDDSLVLESDVVFDPTILAEAVASPAPDIAVVARFEPWMDGTVTLLDEAGRIVRFVSRDEFRWDEAGRYFKTVNLYKLSREFLVERFLPFLETYVRTHGRGSYYEEVLRVLAFLGDDRLTALPVEGRPWYEIDDPHDLDVAASLFAAPEERLDRFERRFGGYWRFPRLADFCYLVNPFFPTPQLHQELGHNLAELVASYPSGSRVQRLLAARLLGLDPALVALGNGACELIQALLAEVDPDGCLGVVLPVFDEYRRLAGGRRLAELDLGERDFACDVAELRAFCEREGVTTLVLVNPANPTGGFVPAGDVARLAEELAARGTRLVLDESFVDFVDGTPEHELAREELLERCPSLVVVKSISKSYGVPGLRLGVLASGDRALIDRIQARVPIWNINSIAEYFLQLVGKYERAYWASCRHVAEERAWLAERLRELGFLRPLPSGANYLLCEVTDGRTGRELAERLLDESWILVKDLGR